MYIVHIPILLCYFLEYALLILINHCACQQKSEIIHEDKHVIFIKINYKEKSTLVSQEKNPKFHLLLFLGYHMCSIMSCSTRLVYRQCYSFAPDGMLLVLNTNAKFMLLMYYFIKMIASIEYNRINEINPTVYV